MSTNRRDFICRTGRVLGATAVASSLEKLGMAHALAASKAPTNYRALVCIFLNGGNDGNNTIIPFDPAGFGAYTTVRGPSGLALTQAELAPFQVTPPGLGPFAFHPGLAELKTLFDQQRLAVVANVGPLVEPMTRAEYIGNLKPRPYQLFSHSDQVQQWQTSISDTRSQTGWGGRTADKTIGLNGGSTFPMILTVAGSQIFALGFNTRSLGINPHPTQLRQVLVLGGFGPGADEVARRQSFDFLRTVDRGGLIVKASQDATTQALTASAAFAVDDPVFTTVFPATSLGNQLRQVAKVIQVNVTGNALNLERQIFFCSTGGFDTHQNQVTDQAARLTQVSQAMKAFYDVTVELGVADRVTTFTLSDFGRTLEPAGSGTTVGTDHGWGNHLFVMGNAVNGGKFYGVQGPNGTVFPTLQLAGPDDTGSRGRWIPTAAVDQYAATLATWYGLGAADVPAVFPNIGNFGTSNLSFML